MLNPAAALLYSHKKCAAPVPIIGIGHEEVSRTDEPKGQATQSSTMTSLPPLPPPPPPLLSLSVLRASTEAAAEEETSDDKHTLNIPSQWSEDSIPEIFKRRKGERKKPVVQRLFA